MRGGAQKTIRVEDASSQAHESSGNGCCPTITSPCPYQYTFVAYTGEEGEIDPNVFPNIKYIKRSCIKDMGHSGSHLVIEPINGDPLEVPRWGHYYTY